MPRIRYVEHDGTAHDTEVPAGWTLMEGASRNGVPGILGDCGGSCACGTCHVYLDARWTGHTPPMEDGEDALLEYATDRRDTSRLSCRITVTEAMDGFVVGMPVRQLS
jgi:2Fe-2S ferredoxin